MLCAGLVVLSQEYEWAARRVEPVKKQAFDVARLGVSTYPRIALSAVGALFIMAVGVFWGIDPPIPSVGPLGPDLPFGGWATGASILLGGVIAMVLLIYSIKVFRAEAVQRRRAAKAERQKTPKS